MNFLLVPLLLIAALCGNELYKLCRNYFLARRSGFNFVVVPVNPLGSFYLFFKNILRPYLEPILPKAVYERYFLSTYGWEFWTKYEVHEKYGSAFMLVTTGDNEVWVADPALAQAFLNRRKDFTQQKIASLVMGLLGENLNTSNGDDWARQRKLVAPNLNERISETVWKESLIQAGQMSQYLLKEGSKGTNKTVDGFKSIALNVLGQAGYGTPQPWSVNAFLTTSTTQKLGYFDAVGTIIDNLVMSAIIPSNLLRLPFMPRSVQKVGQAVQDAPFTANEMLQKERESQALGGEEKTNMMSMLVRLAEQSKSEDVKSGAGGSYLTEDEIRGNLFIFTAAGFDTTANTMSYAAILLAAYPEWQDWIAEELDEVLAGQDPDSLDYTTTFPKLIRLLAFMYETLRHYPPVIHLSRESPHSKTVTTSSGTYHIPAGTKIMINFVGLSLDPAIWGPEATKFNPARWIEKDVETGKPTLITPPKWSFMPWSGGPRACPGQKMSQVEFMAVFTRLFRECRAEPVRRGDETMEEARKRLIHMTENSVPKLTLGLADPSKLELRWTKRERSVR